MSTSVLTRWEPEDPAFWKYQGARIAYRNLYISIPALMLAFVVWMLWSVVAVNLDRAGFHFTGNPAGPGRRRPWGSRSGTATWSAAPGRPRSR
ncbi:hypothetical protein [Cupriavidus sp. SIMBA_020]|uniref:hypothetical protein n=1 Tax=Cupriavidus sp. SIMBA_020 TaxID=3085766 RepID=UPI00397A6385